MFISGRWKINWTCKFRFCFKLNLNVRFPNQGSLDPSYWLKHYLRGASLEMYTETLSNYFVHDLKNFSEAAR